MKDSAAFDLGMDELREVTGFAARCAAAVLQVFERDAPGDARVLGFPQQRIDRWLAELPAALEESRAGGMRVRTGVNGSNGDVVTSVQISHEPGPGGDESVRLWYAISPVTPGEGGG